MMFEKLDGSEENREKSFTSSVNKRKTCRFAFIIKFTHNKSKNRKLFYRGLNCMNKFCHIKIQYTRSH